MAQLVHQLESQQLANRFLKNQIASLQQQQQQQQNVTKSLSSILMQQQQPLTPTTPSSHLVLPLSSSSPSASNSIPSTPTLSAATAAAAAVYAVNTFNSSNNTGQNFESLSKNFFKLNELITAKLVASLNHLDDKETSSSSSKEENETDEAEVSKEDASLSDELDDTSAVLNSESYYQDISQDLDQEAKVHNRRLSENYGESVRCLNLNETKNNNIKKFKRQKSKTIISLDDSAIFLKNGFYASKNKLTSAFSVPLEIQPSSNSINNGSNTSQQQSNNNQTRTPKSALLERRRKAVFELLIHDTYPSGNI